MCDCFADQMSRQATLCLVQLLPSMGKHRVSYATAVPFLLDDINVGLPFVCMLFSYAFHLLISRTILLVKFFY
jgi:hypothetical protein